jgi:predicted GNAT family acetyltransferase
MRVVVTDNPQLNRYEAHLDAELIGFAQYDLQEAEITIFHTEVDTGHQRQGVGGQLAKHALDDVRTRGLRLVPTCPFIAAFVRRHPDVYLDVVAAPLREQVMAGG